LVIWLFFSVDAGIGFGLIHGRISLIARIIIRGGGFPFLEALPR
jgi:hypothetical protein